VVVVMVPMMVMVVCDHHNLYLRRIGQCKTGKGNKPIRSLFMTHCDLRPPAPLSNFDPYPNCGSSKISR